ncbi:hypothetical protein D3C76_1730820 [compost metagenome]
MVWVVAMRSTPLVASWSPRESRPICSTCATTPLASSITCSPMGVRPARFLPLRVNSASPSSSSSIFICLLRVGWEV